MKIVKQLIIIIIPVILVVIVGGLCYLFIPRSLTNIVPMDNIICIYYEYDSTDTAEQIFLTEQEQQELKDILSKKNIDHKILLKKLFRQDVYVFYIKTECLFKWIAVE